MAIPNLSTPRLLLRPWRPEDLEPFAALNADPVVMRFFTTTLSRRESATWIESAMAALQRRQWGIWAVERPGISPFIGFIGLNEPSFQAPFTPCIEIAWRLAQREWGQGLAPEGARAVLDHAFAHVGIHEVVAFTSRFNQPSIRVMEKLGMTRDPAADFQHPALAKDHPLNHCVLFRIQAPAGSPRSGPV